MRKIADYGELRALLRALDQEAVRRHRGAGCAFLEASEFEPFNKKRFARILRDPLEDVRARTTI
jgi:hypothetical protein